MFTQLTDSEVAGYDLDHSHTEPLLGSQRGVSLTAWTLCRGTDPPRRRPESLSRDSAVALCVSGRTSLSLTPRMVVVLAPAHLPVNKHYLSTHPTYHVLEQKLVIWFWYLSETICLFLRFTTCKVFYKDFACFGSFNYQLS